MTSLHRTKRKRKNKNYNQRNNKKKSEGERENKNKYFIAKLHYTCMHESVYTVTHMSIRMDMRSKSSCYMVPTEVLLG